MTVDRIDDDAARDDAGELPAGRLGELVRLVLDQSAGRGGERLAAARRLRDWLDEMERQAVVVARLDGLDWGEIGAAVELDRLSAHRRWGELVGRLEAQGLLPARPPAPAPAEPADPTWPAARVLWCRWCGHRLAMAADGSGWAHTTDGRDLADDLDDECTGPRPWPARDPWPT